PGAVRIDAKLVLLLTSDARSVIGILSTGFLVTQRYMVRPYAIGIHGIRFYYEIGTYAGTFRLDARFLHCQTSDSDSVNGALFTGFPATQPYKVRPYAR